MPRMRSARRSGIERLERVDLLAGADELDRHAGHGADRERRAAAGIAIHLGQDQAGDAEPVVERLGDADRFLAGHGVGHEQDLGRIDLVLDVDELLHHRLVDLQAAGGVDDDRVVARARRANRTPFAAISTGFFCTPSS